MLTRSQKRKLEAILSEQQKKQKSSDSDSDNNYSSSDDESDSYSSSDNEYDDEYDDESSSSDEESSRSKNSAKALTSGQKTTFEMLKQLGKKYGNLDDGKSSINNSPKNKDIVIELNEKDYKDLFSGDLYTDDEEYLPPNELAELKKNNKEIYGKLLQVREYLESKYPDINNLLKSDISLQNKSRLLELYEILSVTPAPSEQWVELRDKINLYFKQSKYDQKVSKKYQKEEQKYNNLISNMELDSAKSSLKYKILQLDAKDSTKQILLKKYLTISNSSEDNNKLKKWLQSAVQLPYNKLKTMPLKCDISKFLQSIKNKLDSELYGMQNVKEQILLFINSKLSNPETTGCSIGLIGPPGTGKTSIARFIAKILDFPFQQISFGGVTNADFIKGHDFTYIGSQPGIIAKSMMRMGYKNGILFFDEFEKISGNKDIVSTLLHITDFSQNTSFCDNYFRDVNIDLSSIWFIYSMNGLPTDSALRDRIFPIMVPGYSLKEKIQIGSKYLLPKNLKIKGLKKTDVTIKDETMKYLINNFTDKENKGMRETETHLKNILNKIHFLVNNPDFNISFALKKKLAFPVDITENMIDKFCKKKIKNPSISALYL